MNADRHSLRSLMTSKLWKCAAITGHGPEEYDSERGAVYCLVRLLIANRLAHGRYYCKPGKHREASKYKSKQSHVTNATLVTTIW